MKKIRKNSFLVALVCALALSLSLFFGSVSFVSASNETLDYSKEFNGSATYSEAYETSGNLDNIFAENATYVYLKSDASTGFYTVHDSLTLGKKFVSVNAVVSVRCIDYVGDRPGNDVMKFWVSTDNSAYTEVASLSSGDVSDAFYTYSVDISEYVENSSDLYFKVTFQYADDCKISHDWVGVAKIALTGKTTVETEVATEQDYFEEIVTTTANLEAYDSAMLDFWTVDGVNYLGARNDVRTNGKDAYYIARQQLDDSRTFNKLEVAVDLRNAAYNDVQLKDVMKFWVSIDNETYTEIASLSTDDVEDAFYTHKVDVTEYVKGASKVYFKISWHFPQGCTNDAGWTNFSKITFRGKTTLPVVNEDVEKYSKTFDVSTDLAEAYETNEVSTYNNAGRVYARGVNGKNSTYVVKTDLKDGRKFATMDLGVGVYVYSWTTTQLQDVMSVLVSVDGSDYHEIDAYDTDGTPDRFYKKHYDITEFVKDADVLYVKIQWNIPEVTDGWDGSWAGLTQVDLCGTSSLPTQEPTEEEYHEEIVTTAANVESYESTFTDFWTIDGVNYLGVRNAVKDSGETGYYIYRKGLNDGRAFNKLEISVSVYCHSWTDVQLKDVMKFWVSTDNETYTEVASLSTDDVDAYQYVKRVDVSEYVQGESEVFFKISWHFPAGCTNDTGWTMFSKIAFDGTTTFPVEDEILEYTNTVNVSAGLEEAYDYSDLKIYENMQGGRTYISSADDVNGYYVAKAELDNYKKFLTLNVGVAVTCTTWIGAHVEDVMKLLVSIDGVNYTEIASLSTNDISDRYYKKYFDITEYVKDKFATQESAVVYVKVQWNFPAGDSNDHSWIALTQIDFYGTTSLALEKTWNDITYVDEFKCENTNVTYYNNGDEIELVDLVKVGYTFDGWYENDVKVESILATDTGDRTFTAKWTLNQYTIEYQNLKGAENGNALTYTVLDTITFAELELEGYTFNGWFENDVEIVSISAGEVGNRVIVADWVATNYIISYVDEFGCDNNNATIYTVESETIVLEGLTKEGYNFLGWYETSDFAGEAITQIAQGSKGNKTLYARWEEVNQGGESSGNESTPSGGESSITSEPEESTSEGGSSCMSSIGIDGLFAVLGAAAIALFSKKRR